MIDPPHPDCPQRRATDASPVTRATGHSASQLALQVLGGLMIAGVVGGISVWGTSLVLGERLSNLSAQVRDLSTEVRDIRRDFYPPRLNRSGAVNMLPAGRP